MILDADLWISQDFKLEDIDEDEPATEIGSVDEFFVDNGRIIFSFNGDGASVHGNIAVVADNRSVTFAKNLARTLNLGSEYRCDDRGRITIGSQYAGKTVNVMVVDDGGDGDG